MEMPSTDKNRQSQRARTELALFSSRPAGTMSHVTIQVSQSRCRQIVKFQFARFCAVTTKEDRPALDQYENSRAPSHVHFQPASTAAVQALSASDVCSLILRQPHYPCEVPKLEQCAAFLAIHVVACKTEEKHSESRLAAYMTGCSNRLNTQPATAYLTNQRGNQTGRQASS